MLDWNAVRVRTHASEGACFEVAFPLATGTGASERLSVKQETEWVASGSVLLIDDDALVRKIVSQLLQRIGFEVTAAASGAAGLAQFRNGPRFDLVVLDWLMPGVSGEQVLGALREAEPDLAVILISGFSIEDPAAYDKRAARLQKPMTMDDLRAAARSLLDREQPKP